MQMPENYKIDGEKLTVIVGEAEYEFTEKQDFIRSDSKKILMKHHAIVVLAQNANIVVSPPVLLSSHDSSCFVIAREAKLPGGGRFSAVGESNPQNLWSEYLEQYPAETADNRAYDRAVLGAVGVYGYVYSTSEFSYNDGEQEKKPVKKPAAVKADEPEKTPEPESPKEETAEEVSDDLPIWWNDIGVGVYSDKQLDPESFIVTEGQCKDKNWTVKQLYDYKYASCEYFATRVLKTGSPTENFCKQVYACRRAIRKYGLKKTEKSA